MSHKPIYIIPPVLEADGVIQLRKVSFEGDRYVLTACRPFDLQDSESWPADFQERPNYNKSCNVVNTNAWQMLVTLRRDLYLIWSAFDGQGGLKELSETAWKLIQIAGIGYESDRGMRLTDGGRVFLDYVLQEVHAGGFDIEQAHDVLSGDMQRHRQESDAGDDVSDYRPAAKILLFPADPEQR